MRVCMIYCCMVLMIFRLRCASAFVAGITRLRYPSSAVSVNRSQLYRSFSHLCLTHKPPTNEELVQRRLEVAREKREARNRSIEQRTQRNLQIKRLLSTQSQATNPSLYSIKVTVCEDLRAELQLSGREKRGRVFVEMDSDAARSIRALKRELHGFFRALRKDTYVLKASYPSVADDGTVSVKAEETEYVNSKNSAWSIETDEDVADTFAKANNFFRNHDALKRPSIVVHVYRNPNAPPPPPSPAYLNNMADPKESPAMTMLSFYAFPPSGIEHPDEFAVKLRKAWKPFDALGRVYVACEGVNAQMSVPTNVLNNFFECCRSVPELEFMENGINVDPIPLSREEFAVAGGPASGGQKALPPFKNLHIRVRRKVVADGLDKSYDWQKAGYDMPPLEWHKRVKKARASREQGADVELPIIIDCRNTYETDIGTFEGAEPLNTENFRESWKVLEERLAGVSRDAEIMTFCTGGIRCVKVNAWLTQKLRFTNVSRLASGIIGYDRTLKEAVPDEESMFKGTNFVFDGRLGRPITEDSLGTCITCGAETSLICNCRNENCHKRMIQCEACRTDFRGTCSDACRQRLLNGAMTPRRSSEETLLPIRETGRRYITLEEYSSGLSSPLPSVYAELERNTRALIPSGSHMISGGAQGRLLTQIASMTREGRVLELGTFTGYATTCLLEGVLNAANASGLTDRGVIGSQASGPYVLTMERDSRAFEVAVNHLKLIATRGFSEESAEQLAGLLERAAAVTDCNDNKGVAPDSSSLVSLNCGSATCDLVRVSDALAAVEEMAVGRGPLLGVGPFDMVFVDADKTRLFAYVNVFLESDRLLKNGGFIIVDNVLYKGLVLDAVRGDFSSALQDDADVTDAELRRNRRARKLASKMNRFNEAIALDDRAEVVVLPLRDGLSVIRKK